MFLLSTLMKTIKEGALNHDSALYLPELRTALLSCLTSFEGLHEEHRNASNSGASRTLKYLWGDGDPFDLVLGTNEIHLPLACKFPFSSNSTKAFRTPLSTFSLSFFTSAIKLSATFATYVMTSASKQISTNPLLCAETWDYLRDVLLLRLPHLPRESVTASSVEESLLVVFEGLTHVYHNASPGIGECSVFVLYFYRHLVLRNGGWCVTARWIQCSPYMINLRAVLLETVSRLEGNPEGTYSKLKSACLRLKELVRF